MRTSLQRAGWRRLRAALAISVASLTWVSMAVTPARAVNEDTLASLQFKVSGSTATLSPSFASGTVTYSIPSVPWTEKDLVQVKATATDLGVAQMEWRVRGDGSGTYHALPSNTLTDIDGLEAGSNIVDIRVTSNLLVQKVYAITVPVAAPSSVTTFATFGCVAVCSLTPAFSPSTRTYTTNWVDETSLDIFFSLSAGAEKVRVWRWESPEDAPNNADWATATEYTDTDSPFPIGAGGSADGFEGAFEVGHTPSVYSFQVEAQSGATAEYVLYVYKRSTDDDAHLTDAASPNQGLKLVAGSTLTLIQASGTSIGSSGFDDGVKDYTAAVPAGTTSVSLRAIAAIPGEQLLEYQNSSLTSTWTTIESGVYVAVNLGNGANVIKVRVRSGDGPPYTETTSGFTRQATYSVTVSGGSSASAGLSALVCTTCTLSPAFASDTKTYTSTVAATVTSVTFKPTVSNGTVACEVNGTAVTANCASDSAFTANLNTGNNTVKITVTPSGGGSAVVYTVTVTRGSPVASLATLTVTPTTGGCTLTPAFVPNSTTVKEFACTVPNAATSVTVVATPSSTETLGYRVGGSGDFGNTTTLNLSVIGANVVEVKATLGTGNNAPTTTYKITVTRQGEGKLSGITLTAGGKTITLSPAFSKDVLNYTATVASASVLLAVTKVETSATLGLTVNTVAATFAGTSTSITLKPGKNPIVITVTPAGGGTAVVYTLTITGKRCIVPNVVGKSFGQAKQALRTAGCGWTVTKVSSTKAKGTVLSQTPVFNASKPKQNRKGLGFKVALTISKGSGASVAMSLRGQNRTQSRVEAVLRRGVL